MARLLWAVAALIVFSARFALADAREGEFFGYKLWDRYPYSESTKVVPSNPLRPDTLIAVAAQPHRPDGMGEVRVVLTRKTHTIGQIYSHTEFSSSEAAADFAFQYAKLLRAKYSDWEPVPGSLLSTTLEIIYRRTYRLSVDLLDTLSPPAVQISLILAGDPEARWNKQASQEYDSRVLEDPKQKELLRGM